MKRGLRTRRFSMWLAVMFFVMSLVALVLAMRGETLLWWSNESGRAILIRNYQFIVLQSPLGGFEERSSWQLGLKVYARPLFPPVREVLWVPNWGRVGAHWWCSIPLWTPPVALAIAVIVLWRLERAPPRGHCGRCGYDLTGNVSGICPECGESVSMEHGGPQA